MGVVEQGELAKKLGVSKKTLHNLVYMKGSTFRYTHEEDGRRMYDEDEVIRLLRKGMKLSESNGIDRCDEHKTTTKRKEI